MPGATTEIRSDRDLIRVFEAVDVIENGVGVEDGDGETAAIGELEEPDDGGMLGVSGFGDAEDALRSLCAASRDRRVSRAGVDARRHGLAEDRRALRRAC